MHKSSSNVSAVIDLSFSDDDLSIEHEKSKKKVAKNEVEKSGGKDTKLKGVDRCVEIDL